MKIKIGRNDPCPCDSGKKYKHCCALAPQEGQVIRKGHDGAVERAVNWLETYHRKAISHAIDIMLYEGLNDAEQQAIDSLDDQTWHGIQLNATEWLLAEGIVRVKNEDIRVVDLLLGKGGPLFTVGQRDWIKQLSEQPLRLYDVTDVIPNQQMTLCDAIDTNLAPIVVKERSGSQTSLIGHTIGARLMRVDDHFELSGAVYPFSQTMSAHVLKIIKNDEISSAKKPHDKPQIPQQLFISFLIRRKWIEQYIKPPTMPAMTDMQSGEPILLVTDHYRVKDWDLLCKLLESKKEIEGDRHNGWSRLKKFPDGLTRSISTINISQHPDRIELFHKTQAESDKGRKWFDKIAGEVVEHLGREISDPIGVLKNKPLAKSKKTPSKQLTKKSNSNSHSNLDLDSEVIASLIEQRIHQLYANWVNEPIPALDGKTPKEAITTPSGLERVKGLIRSYEESEEIQATEQGRREISYAFLWNAIGLTAD